MKIIIPKSITIMALKNPFWISDLAKSFLLLDIMYSFYVVFYQTTFDC